MYEKAPFYQPKLAIVKKNSNEAPGSSHSKIHYSDYPKRFINRINKVHVSSIKYRYSAMKVDPRCTSEV